MTGVRETGRRRLVLATAGVAVLAAATATAVGATRPAPHRAAPVPRDRPARPPGGGVTPPTVPDEPAPVATSGGS